MKHYHYFISSFTSYYHCLFNFTIKNNNNSKAKNNKQKCYHFFKSLTAIVFENEMTTV